MTGVGSAWPDAIAGKIDALAVTQLIESMIQALREEGGIKTVTEEKRCYALAVTKLEEAGMWLARAREKAGR